MQADPAGYCLYRTGTVATGRFLLYSKMEPYSTILIKCLATLLEIDGGEAFGNGFSVRTQPDQVRLSMNLVGSGHWVGFDWGMTVVQNLHCYGSLYGLSKAERTERIEQTLEQLRMIHLANETPRTLSSGERQRMLLAKGFMIRTPVFFLDEPTVGLDPGGIREVCAFIKGELIGQLGTPGILITHRMSEAEALCSRIAIMNKGKIVACGTPLELKQLAGQEAILEATARHFPPAVVEAIRQMRGVRAAAAAPAGSDGLEESLRVHSDDPERLVGAIADMLQQYGVDAELQVAEPALEDAFIALTDRRLE